MSVERKCFFVSADVGGGGTRVEALRTSGWEAIFVRALGVMLMAANPMYSSAP